MSVRPKDVFDASSLVKLMVSSISLAATPQIRDPYDAIALLSHACMLAVGFRLVGLGEDHKIEETSNVEDYRPLPSQWNTTKSSDYSFRYAHTQSSLQYLVKISRLGGKAVINGIGLGDDKVHSLDVQVQDYVSESSTPFTVPTEVSQAEYASSVQRLFISEGRIADFASLIKLKVIQNLAPGLRKEGYEDNAFTTEEQMSSSRERRQPIPGREPYIPSLDPLQGDHLPPSAQPRPLGDPLSGSYRPHPVADFPPPGFEDEYEINRLPGGLGGARRPLNIGERDLYPPGLGPHDPLRGGGFHPVGGLTGGGGMHPTFDDPIFRGDTGIDGYDHRAPPGARYDPVGPGDRLPNLHGGRRFPGSRPPDGFGGGGGTHNPFSGFGGNDFI